MTISDALGSSHNGKDAGTRSASSGYSGYLSIDPDHTAGIIRVRGVGMWTPQQAQVYFDEMARITQPIRALKAPVRVLIDLREAPVQSAATAEAMANGSANYDPQRDRVAFICLSKLFGMQLKRSIPSVISAFFEDEAEALAWVLSDEPNDAN